MSMSVQLRPLFEGARDNPYRRTCMLMVTRDCNLNCKYCYETHKDKGKMSFNLAREIILKEADFVRHSKKFHELEIDFMGGEPLMNFELIKEVVEWLSENPLSVPFVCYIITNGTLLDDAKRRWFRRYKNIVWMGLSVDGTEEMQIENRGVKKSSMDLSFFHELWPSQRFHMTVSQETLPFLSEGVLSLQKKGYPLEVALAQGVDWTLEDAKTFRQEMSKIGQAYLSNDSLEPINMFERYLVTIDSEDVQQIKFCGTGTHMNTYDIDGVRYGCHMFTPIVLGRNAVPADKIKWNDKEENEDPRCLRCILKTICPTCPGFNYRYRGSIGRRDMRGCLMTLAGVLSVCEYQLAVLSRKVSYTETEARYAYAALETYKKLSKIDFPNVTSPFKFDDFHEGKKGGEK